MTVLTLRYIKGDFVVTAPDIAPMKFKSRREARDWCQTHHPGSPITEVWRKPRGAASRGTVTLSPDDPLAKARKTRGRTQ
jgi:hypothetical protein